MNLELVNFSHPIETRAFERGRLELYRIGPMTVGRAIYEPGWRQSEHVGPTAGTASCQVEHVGLALAGQAAVKMEDGTERLMREGDFFYLPPGHDSWVVGDEPYVSLHILGSEPRDRLRLAPRSARDGAAPRSPGTRKLLHDYGCAN